MLRNAIIKRTTTGTLIRRPRIYTVDGVLLYCRDE